jgi:hypothetical protein
LRERQIASKVVCRFDIKPLLGRPELANAMLMLDFYLRQFLPSLFDFPVDLLLALKYAKVLDMDCVKW